MKSLWRSLLLVCALSGVLTVGVAVGCGPQQAFCPNTGTNGGYTCPILGDDAQAPPQAGTSGQTCPDGSVLGFNDASPPMLTCVPN